MNVPKRLIVAALILAAACSSALADSRSTPGGRADRAAPDVATERNNDPASVGDPFYPYVADGAENDLGLNPHTATCDYAPWEKMQHHDEQKFIKVTITSPAALPKGTVLIIELSSGEKWTKTLHLEFPAGIGFFYVYAPDTIPLEGFLCSIAIKAPATDD
jgi:hypothetical protein